MTLVDLTNCDREPIHIPGKIQAQGFLIVIDKDGTINHCSENIMHFLPVDAVSLLGSPISHLHNILQNKDLPNVLSQLLNSNDADQGFETANPYPLAIGGKPFNLIISLSNLYYLLEFEPEISDLQTDVQNHLNRAISEMLADADLSHLVLDTARQIKSTIGYDRVMIYKFHEDGHGEVVAEAKNDDLTGWLGLHYPASDIPKQARDLYKINLVRLIADVETTPSAIITFNQGDDAPLDLTNSVLRAVSPIHIQYLKNMGVASSFSVSLLKHGELWGLVACHNYTPRLINYREREAAKLIGQVLSSALSFRQQEEDQQKVMRLTIAVDALAIQLLRDNNVTDALFNYDITLNDAVECGGAALIFDNQLFLCGDTPTASFINELTEWLNETMEGQLFSSDNLPLIFEAAVPHQDKACGILACRLQKEPKEYVIWFRPEILTTVNWAGDPDKPVTVDANGTRSMSPRKSFATWSQTVQHRSAPWKTEDLKSAQVLKDEVAFAINRKSAEIRLLNDKLKEAYDDLDTFSYTISHDLRNPLTSIKIYTELLYKNSSLDAKAQKMVERILGGANKMDGMIRDVLSYSKVGQAAINQSAIDMAGLLNGIKQELLVGALNPNLQINIGDTPNVHGDTMMMMQVFSNLLSNAVKYSGQSVSPVVVVEGIDLGTTIQYSVTDNGIGIIPADQETIFDLFARSADVKAYEGSGIGLSIVKKIMEKHQGKIWVESSIGAGATFYVSFPQKQ